MKIWSCKIGEVDADKLPHGSDLPMREAVGRAYKEITGEERAFIFSGWGAELTEPERAAVENREPSKEYEAQWRKDNAVSASSDWLRDWVRRSLISTTVEKQLLAIADELEAAQKSAERMRERCIARIHQAFETELSVMHGHEEEHLIDVLRALDLGDDK